MSSEKDKKASTATILSLYAQIWLYQLLGLVIFAVARVVHLVGSGATESIATHSDSLPMFLWNAWRFDTQALTYISLPAILASLIVPWMGSKATEKCSIFMRRYYAVMLAVLGALVTAEFFFFENFGCRYNVVFFDFFDEGPWGLLQTMWQDYPFLRILLSIFALGIFIHFTGRFIARIRLGARQYFGTAQTIVATIIIAALTFVFMRGSVTRYTLQVEAFMVSTDERINNAVPNAVYLLKKAYKERANSFKLYSDEQLLAREGFTSIDEAIKTAALPLAGETNAQKCEAALFATVEKSDTLPHPNVLLILSESWSNFLTKMDKGERLDLLCSLRQHLQQDILLQNFQSVRNGTIYSIETVTLTMPYMRFFNSRYRFESFQSSIAHPFKQQGYSTAFITGMDPTWENVQEGLRYQSFDTIIGRQDIMHSIEGSTTSAIGVYDEFLMQYLFEHLDSGSGDTPQFVVALTTTNHPPFTYPENMQLPPLTEEWYNSPYLTGDKEVLRKYGLGAQYANRCIGDFLTRLKASPLAQNTIVVITGDHNVRSILDYDKVPAEQRYAVPLYIYLPQRYALSQEDEERIERRYGSHYDLLSTIAPLALNNGARYLNVGHNLLDTTATDESFSSYSEKQLLAPDGADTDALMRRMKARELLMEIYYQQHFRNQ